MSCGCALSSVNAATPPRRSAFGPYTVSPGTSTGGATRGALYVLNDCEGCANQIYGYAADEATGALTMGEADWSRQGWHSDSGLYTAEGWLRIYAAHAHNHAAQIDRLREALGARA